MQVVGWAACGQSAVPNKQTHQPFRGSALRPVRAQAVRRPSVRYVVTAAAAGAEAEEKQSPLSRLFGGGGGTQRLKAGVPTPSSPAGGTRRLRRGQRSAPAQKDPNTVFLAGATGRLGARILRALLEVDPAIKVRAAARSAARGQELLDIAAGIGALPADAARRVSIVEVDLTNPEDIRAAVGSASKVVQAIGAPESEPFNFQLPEKIDGDAAISLVEAATAAGVDQYVMVTSLGTGKWGWPAGILNLFGGVLIQKRRAEVALEESGLPYVIVRPGGMERPKDDYKETHNVRLAPRDSEFGGQVSRWQVAELIAAAVANPSLAENKVLEAVAETEAPLLPYGELLAGAVCEEPQAERAERVKAVAAAKAELAAASERVEAAKAAVAEAENVAKQLAEAAARAWGEVDTARANLKDTAPQVFEAQSLESQLEERRAAQAAASQTERAAKAVLVAATAAARQGRLLSDAERTDAERSVRQPEQWAADQEAKRAAQTQADAKATQEAAEAQRRSSEEKIRAGMERAKRESEAARAADEQRARAAKQAKLQAEVNAKKALEAQERAREDAKAKAEEDAKRRTKEVQDAIQAQKKAEEVRLATAATAKAEKAAKENTAASAMPKIAKQKAPADAEQTTKPDASPKAEVNAKAALEAQERAREESTVKAEEDAKRRGKQGQDAVQAQEKAEEVRLATAATAKAEKAAKEKAAASAMPKIAKQKAPEDAEQTAKPDASPKGKGAEEARTWIEAWRNGGSGAGAPQNSNGATPQGDEGGLPLVSDVGEGPLTWLQKLRVPWARTGAQEELAPQPAQGNGASPPAGQAPVKPSVQEAREWIRQWRARTLEKALPKGVTAKQ